MRKDAFLKRLEMLLSDISAEEREEAMAFYRGYFEDAGEENEEAILAELGSPENVAETIKRDLGMVAVTAHKRTEDHSTNSYETYTDSKQEQEKKNSWMLPLIIIIAVITFPIWFGVLMGIIGMLFGLSIALITITFAVFVVGAVFVGLGIAMLAGFGMAIVSIPVGLAFVGSGLLVLASGLLLVLACVVVFGKFLPWACKGIINLCKKPFAKKEAQTV